MYKIIVDGVTVAICPRESDAEKIAEQYNLHDPDEPDDIKVEKYEPDESWNEAKLIHDTMQKLGKKGGSKTSQAKKKSSAKNGKLGGRPVYKWSVTYSKGHGNFEAVVTAATARAAIKEALDTFDDFGKLIPRNHFRWCGDLYCASSGNWEEFFSASKFEE